MKRCVSAVFLVMILSILWMPDAGAQRMRDGVSWFSDTSRGDWQSTKLYYVTQGIVADAASAVADWGERDFGNPQTLIDFVAWTKSPARLFHRIRS